MKYFLDVIKDGFNPHDDEDLAITRNLYWCMVESGLGLLAVCLPTLRSLWGTKASGWLTSVRSVFTLRSNISEPSKTSYAGSNKYANIADRGLSAGKSSQEVYILEDRASGASRSHIGQETHSERGDGHV
jgi:hypothetical protein